MPRTIDGINRSLSMCFVEAIKGVAPDDVHRPHAMQPLISLIVPNRNGAATLARCLRAALASRYPRFVVIVVDDASADNSVAVIRRYPCRWVRLERHGGAARARNAGAAHARGQILFFTDADCLLEENALARAAATLVRAGPGAVVGGTYTRAPADRRFFSRFQSVFIHYSETRGAHPDYLATHALAIRAADFHASGGFREDFLPILEDVEFSHRLRRHGHRLVMDPAIRARHVFNHSLTRSLTNAFRKSMYWTLYSLRQRDLLADSGTASLGLKANVAAYAAGLPLLTLALFTGEPLWAVAAATALGLNLYANRGLLAAFHRARGLPFALAAGL
ncbi:MAG: glycosyltransferase, partial [Rhodocyclales bacterium]|nr:glycosyltransferase [Rhodocyclales bacterium]